MDERLLRDVVAQLNDAPETAERTASMAPLITDTNQRIGAAGKTMPFDSTPYAMPLWFAVVGKP